MVRRLVAGLLTALLAALFAGSAVARPRGIEAPAAALDAPAAGPALGEEHAEHGEDDSSDPAGVARLDPIEEHASVAPRPEKIRHLPVTRALAQDLLARRVARVAPPPPTPCPGSGCAEVARWCLAHATSTSTP
ncbi:MAG TPA: hypothetical protein VLA62_00925 [Solirubrobacterales bacterium]|nr:hypothetical protein [Solirubrobacterales bacterium]